MEQQTTDSEVNLIWVGSIIEGGLALLALLLAWFGLYDHLQPLRDIDGASWIAAFRWGAVATLPLLVYLAIFHFFKPRIFQPMQEFVVEQLYPLFRGSSIFEMLLLSLMAGFGEEMLFRWCLQGGLTTILEPRAGLVASQMIGLVVASILFGLCHWVNASYGFSTLVIGLYLGLTMIWTGSFLVPAMAHAMFDFVALIYISRLCRDGNADRA
jgi:membrane protease YdiL (CAAX protease family)